MGYCVNLLRQSVEPELGCIWQEIATLILRITSVSTETGPFYEPAITLMLLSACFFNVTWLSSLSKLC